jgi:hypothetical protein
MSKLNVERPIARDVTVKPRATAPVPGALIILGLVGGLAAFSTHADPDLWSNVRFGLDVLRDHSLPTVDPYSFTSNLPWMNHEWLSEAIMAFVYTVGGTLGLALLKATLTISTLAVAWVALNGVATAPRALSIVLIVWSGLPLTGTLRPQLWSWLLCAVLLALLPRQRARWAIPLLFACWANLHGGWIVGFGLVVVWACATRTKEALLLVGSSALATLATPYGVHLWTFLARTVRLGRADIQEWQPLWTAPVITWIPVAGAWLLLLWALFKRRLSAVLLLGCVALGIAAIRVQRLEAFFVIAAAIWLPPRTWPPSSPLVWVEAVAAVAVFAATLAFRAPHLSCLDIGGDWAPDLTVDVGGRGTLLVPFDWGHYAIWRWGPQLRVSIDGRRETIYSDDVINNQGALETNDPRGLAWLDTHRPDLVWYRLKATMVREHLVNAGYRVLLETDRSYVLAAPTSQVTASRRPVTMCFPG